MPEYRYIIPPEYDGKPIRTAVVYGLGMSSGLYKQIKFHGEVLVDGLPLGADKRVWIGQEVVMRLPEKAKALPEGSARVLSVPYEDEYLLIVDKPAPLPTGSSIHQDGETLKNLVLSHLHEPADFVYRPVNRLDKGTSGLMVVAKDARTQDRLQRLLHTEMFRREYLAVCEGIPQPLVGTINAPIAKADEASIKRIISPEGKEAKTAYEVVWHSECRSIVRLRLYTGRTHQIRVHLSLIGCPVCGDFLYGTELAELSERFALHSAELWLHHPITGEELHIVSELPDELVNVSRETMGGGEPWKGK